MERPFIIIVNVDIKFSKADEPAGSKDATDLVNKRAKVLNLRLMA